MKRTATILVAAAVGLSLYDVSAAATPEEEDTISEVLAAAARKRPVIAFGFGLLAGHWFWPLTAPTEKRNRR